MTEREQAQKLAELKEKLKAIQSDIIQINDEIADDRIQGQMGRQAIANVNRAILNLAEMVDALQNGLSSPPVIEKAKARDEALLADHQRGRSKLFKD